MILDPVIFATIVVALGSLVGLLGGVLGLIVFLEFRRKIYFLDYVNRKLSGRNDNEDYRGRKNGD